MPILPKPDTSKRTFQEWTWQTWIFVGTAGLLTLHLVLHLAGQHQIAFGSTSVAQLPLLLALVAGGLPLVWELLDGLWHGRFGSDLLAAVSIVTSIVLGEYLAGTIVVMMLSGGQALESYAVRNASSVLDALARRMPRIAHKKVGNQLVDVELDEVNPGDFVVVNAKEICPVDGVVQDGHGSMDESYLSGEPYQVPKATGATVMSGAINGEAVLTVEVTRRSEDSRYAKIMQVMQDSAQRKPTLRRMGDRLGALYTPLALVVACLAWWFSGDVHRFLAVLVIATPCPLLLGIPIAVIGTISLAARRGIIVKDPAVLEHIATVKCALFDKTGTLTYGEPILSECLTIGDFQEKELLSLSASLEQYSRHPLSVAVQRAAKAAKAPLLHATAVHEVPGQGLTGRIADQLVWITSRKLLAARLPDQVALVPPRAGGLECLVVINDRFAGLLRFRDEIRPESSQFVKHLSLKHGISRLLLVSGDREEEARYLADRIGAFEVFANQSPEEKVEITRRETQLAPTMYVGDGINDAPALAAATVGIAFGSGNEITSEAADIVVLEGSLTRVDEILHLGKRMRSIALQSAIGGMVLSMGGMFFAAAGLLPPIAGAITQEVIDVVAILNALRAAWPPSEMSHFDKKDGR